MTIDELAAREEIRLLLTRYTYAGDRGRLTELAACFANDGVLEFPGSSATGPDAIMAALSSGTRNTAINFVRHHIANPLIDVSQDRHAASARSYFEVVSNNGPDHAGTYSDQLVNTADGWRFAHRLVRVDWQSPASLFRPMTSR
jgi:SnoaL-like domain